MKIVIVSDSHGDANILRIVAKREEDAMHFVHAGDLEDTEESAWPFSVVLGNRDFLPLKREIVIHNPFGDGDMLIRHRPLSGKGELEGLKRRGIRYFVHGHTHEKEKREEEGIVILCPGSVSYPRDGTASYLSISGDKGNVSIEFKFP